MPTTTAHSRLRFTAFTHAAALLLLAAAGMVATAGCATPQEQIQQRRPGATDLRVTAFIIEGTEAFSPNKIKSGLVTHTDPGAWASPALRWVPLVGAERYYFNWLTWKKDLERIKTFYEARGYFNAKIVSENIVKYPEKGTVQLKLTIAEGQPTKVSEIDVHGLDNVQGIDRDRLMKKLPLAQGEIFREDEYLRTKGGIVDALKREGYAYAEISGKAVVRLEQQTARVRYIVDPGPRAVFGEIRIDGVKTIPKSYIRAVIDIEPGDPYSSQALQEAQDDIYTLEVFSLVSVLPAHQAREKPESAPPPVDGEGAEQTGEQTEAAQGEIRVQEEDEEPPGTVQAERQARESDAPGGPMGISHLLNDAQKSAEERIQLDQRVPIVIRVKEARNWNVRVGAGLALERNRQDVHGLLEVSSQNFFGGLRKFYFTNTLGYAWAPGFFLTEGDETQASRQGIIWKSQAEFVQPWLVGGRTNLRLTPSVGRDIQIGYKLWNPSARIGVDHSFNEHLTVGIGYRVSYFNFDEVDRDLAEDTPLGEDFQPEFLLEYLEQNITFDYRDNPLDPRSGFLSQLNVQEATRYIFGGEFTYLKTSLSTEGYIPFDLFTEMVLALRGEFGVLYNLEPVERGPNEEVNTQRVPTIARFDSGGRNSMRSFGRNALSIYKGTVPVGGSTHLELSIEPRFQLVENLLGVGDLWMAVFADAATVNRGQFLAETNASQSLQLETTSAGQLFEDLLYGAGTGIWWVTPIGPVRLDFAYTLSSFENDERFRLCQDGTNAIRAMGGCTLQEPGDDELLQSLSRFNFLIGIGHSF